MNKKFRKIVALCSIISLGLASCSPEPEETPVNSSFSNGLFVMCEGNDGLNNAVLNFFDRETGQVSDVMANFNSQSLGDVTNSMISFGDKLFISVKGSACVIVLSKTSGKLLYRIPTVNSNGQNRLPSRFTTDGTMLYLCCVDGSILEINPQTYNTTRQCTAGRNPEDICCLDGKLYVTNSGGLDWNTEIGYDNSVSIIDLRDFSERKVVVGLNPSFIKPLKNGLLGIVVRGNYVDIGSKFVVMTLNGLTAYEYPLSITNFDVLNNYIVYTDFDWQTFQPAIKRLNFLSAAAVAEDFTTNSDILNQITSPYGININPIRNEIYITDAKDYTTSGEVFIFDTSGNYKYKFRTDIIPSIVL